MRRSIVCAAALSVLAAACSSGSSTPAATRGTAPGSTPAAHALPAGELTFVAALQSVGNCDAVLDHLRTEAATRVGPYGLPGSGPIAYATGLAGRSAAPADATAPAPAAASPGAASTDSTAAPGDYSTTNVQEVGVDEADIVKSDGTHIFTIANGVLSIADARAATPTVVGRAPLDSTVSRPQDLLVAGDHLLVLGTDSPSISPSTFRGPVPQVAAGIAAPVNGASHATVTEVDVHDPTTPHVGATLRVDGAELSARLVGHVARVVIRSEPGKLDFVMPQSPAGTDRAKRTNQQVVEESTLEDWLPSYTLLGPDGTTRAHGLLPDCSRVDAPSEFAGFGSLSVLTFDLTKPLGTGDAATILAGGQTVYASPATLYVATESYVEPADQANGTLQPRLEQSFSTSIHAFDIRGDGPATYVASGTVPGHVLDQFSLSEDNGTLRVATTRGTPWGTNASSDSLITVLEPHDKKLDTVGQVSGMGKGERIYSVRFAGPTAYVVTFRQTDPFITVDLTDPHAPRVVGQLEITGYSGYLHPLGDDLVLGVGQDATLQGRVQGTKVTLFDVHDLAQPRALASWTLPGSQSGAVWDHHAFLWWPATRSVVLPVTDWSQGFSGAVVLHVERTAITEVGRITHPASAIAGSVCGKPAGPATAPSCPSSRPQPAAVVRSLVVGSMLWTLSAATLQANALDTLAVRADLTLG